MKDKSKLSLAAVIQRSEKHFVARCPELDVVSQGKTIKEAHSNLAEAVKLFLETASPAELKRRLHKESVLEPGQPNFILDARREILEQGVAVDALLATDPDGPVFGFNLACAWPFPAPAARFYRPIAERLAALDPAVYVYPEWETHVTILTFVNFSLHRRPEPERLAQLQSLIQPVRALIGPLLERPAFKLMLGPPVLTRKAAILPISDPTSAIADIRQTVRAALAADKGLHAELARGGLNVPGIIHSTIMRFKSQPGNLAKFLAEFDDAAAAAEPFTLTIDELLLTTETKPYMRAGEIADRFPLAPAGGEG
jgi:predicted RNase H-like HicB family nuclease